MDVALGLPGEGLEIEVWPIDIRTSVVAMVWHTSEPQIKGAGANLLKPVVIDTRELPVYPRKLVAQKVVERRP